EKYRPYLFGKKFYLHTDHQAIKFLGLTKNTSARLLRWALKLQEYDFEICYIPESTNIADSLSRQIHKVECKTFSDKQKQYIILKLHIELGHDSRRNMLFNSKSKSLIWSGLSKEIDDLIQKCHVSQKCKSGPKCTSNYNVKKFLDR
ncbi:putative transposable element, partial [Pseudoloma neurophilia]